MATKAMMALRRFMILTCGTKFTWEEGSTSYLQSGACCSRYGCCVIIGPYRHKEHVIWSVLVLIVGLRCGLVRAEVGSSVDG